MNDHPFQKTIAEYYHIAAQNDPRQKNRNAHSAVRLLLGFIGLRMRDAILCIKNDQYRFVWRWQSYIITLAQHEHGFRPPNCLVFSPADQFDGRRFSFNVGYNRQTGRVSVGYASNHCFAPSGCYEWHLLDDETDELIEALGFVPDPRTNACSCSSPYDCEVYKEQRANND